MNNQNLVRGLFLTAVSILFGANAIRHTVGTFARAGPGMFPALMSGMLLLIALTTLARSSVLPIVPLDINLRNIALLLGALCAFALISKVLNMTAGVAALVFIAALAGRAKYSVVWNVKIAAGLIAVAFAFQKLLGLNLPLF